MATVTLVPLGTYPAQTRSFEAALPAGTTAIKLVVHAPVQNLFSYTADFWLSTDGGATWEWLTGAGCNCKATDSTIWVDTPQGGRLRVDLALTTPITASIVATTTP